MDPPVYSESDPPQYGETEYQEPCRGADSTETQSTTTTTRPTTQTTRAATPTTRPTKTTLATTMTRPTTTTRPTTINIPTTTTTTPIPTTTTTRPTTPTRPTTINIPTTTTTTPIPKTAVTTRLTTTTTRPTTTTTRPTTTTTTTTRPTTETTTSTTTTTTTTPRPTQNSASPTTITTAKPATTQAPTPPPVQPCHNTTKADIILLLDASTSIGSINWQKQIKFADEVTQAFTVGANDVRFGTLLFNKSPTKIFDLKTYFDNQSISQAILSIEYPYRSGTNTHLGLKEIREQKLFSPENGGRDGVKNIVIVMTDGLSTLPTLTQEEATLLKNEDVTLISVGIGSGVDKTELQGIASKPAYVFLTGGYNLLDLIKSDLVQMTCESVSN